MIRIEGAIKAPKSQTKVKPDGAAAVDTALSEIAKVLVRHELQIRALTTGIQKLVALQAKQLEFSKSISERLDQIAKPAKYTSGMRVN